MQSVKLGENGFLSIKIIKHFEHSKQRSGVISQRTFGPVDLKTLESHLTVAACCVNAGGI